MKPNDIQLDQNEILNLPPERSFWKSIRNYFRQYCVCSSIHGFRYFGEKRTHFERAWWFIIFSITLSSCCWLIRETYRKWERSPVIVSFATRETPIYRIPFPSVTICPESKFLQEKYNTSEILQRKLRNESLSDLELKRFEFVSLICNKHPAINYTLGNDTFDENEFLEEIEKISVLDFLKFHDCEFLGRPYNCSKIFKPILTDEGLCLTFNMLDRTDIYRSNVKHYSNFHDMKTKTYKNWTLDHGYVESAGPFAYPRRALLAGASNALSITLSATKKDLDPTCKDSMQGFRVILHTPGRIPRPSQEYFRIPYNQVVIASIQPVMITTSESVKKYNPKRRECFFSSERRLKYFKTYSQLNCKLECLTNETLQHCDCVNFFMPRDNKTDLCGTGSWKCMQEAEHKFQMGDLYKQLNNFEWLKKKKKLRTSHCNCLPICADLSYDVETSQSDWSWKIQHEQLDEDVFHSKLLVYFKSTQFITSQRHELYGPTDFLANFGGLLGLFTGFSILSFMEIIYFLTIRLFCNLRLYGYWAGPEV